MNTKRPAVVTIAAILLIILSLFVGGLGLARQFGVLGAGFGGRQFMANQFRNPNFTLPNGFPPNGFPEGGFPNNGGANGQNNQRQLPNFTPNRMFGTGFARLFGLFRPVVIGLDIILLVLAGVAVLGLFKKRRWGATLALVLAVLLFLLAIPGFIRIFSPLVIIENLARMLVAVAIIVLLLLPAARQSYLPARESVDD
jgi:hypothetical protein